MRKIELSDRFIGHASEDNKVMEIRTDLRTAQNLDEGHRSSKIAKQVINGRMSLRATLRLYTPGSVGRAALR